MSRKILVPLDGSKLAECALNYAKTLVHDGSESQITLLSIVRVDMSWGRIADINTIKEKVILSSRQYLAELESNLKSEEIKVNAELLEANSPADAITEYAQANGMDMILIATHGYTGFKKMMLGSVAFGVLTQSHVPVLLIRPESCRG